LDDVELLAAIAAGDELALATLHQRFAGTMYAIAFRVTRSEGLAQEAVQDAFMAVWRTPGRFDPARGALGPWMFTLVRHKAIDLVRRESVVRRRVADVDLELREAPDDVHDDVWRGLRAEQLQEAIRQLPDNQRRALELAFLGGLTHVEVAEKEGIPLGTAKTRIRSALLRLRENLEPSLGDDALAVGRPPGPFRGDPSLVQSGGLP
jgi:RNA polymerase sigma factor (sigma-70 family)